MNNNEKLVSDLVIKHGKTRESLMPILQGIADSEQCISQEVMVEVARQLDIAAAEVYGTASFYTFLETGKHGKYIIRVCKSIIAEMKGKKEIVKTLEGLLKIKVGETSSDGMFTLKETNDIGWSDQEPSMLINDTPYTNLTPEKVIKIIQDIQQISHN